jgi:predicted transcriptional regulator
MRDRAEEEMFFAIYGSSAVQAVLGVNSGEKVHALPGTTLEKRADRSGVCRRRCSKGEQRRVRRGRMRAALVERSLGRNCVEHRADERSTPRAGIGTGWAKPREHARIPA